VFTNREKFLRQTLRVARSAPSHIGGMRAGLAACATAPLAIMGRAA